MPPKVTKPKQVNLTSLFRALYTGIEEDDREQILDSVERLLHVAPDNKRVALAKCVTLLNEGQFEAAEAVVNQYPNAAILQDAANERDETAARTAIMLLICKAYASYRRNNLDAALETLKSIPEAVYDLTIKNLQVQTLYKQGSFNAAAEQFAAILAEDPELTSDPEYVVNAMAINIMAGRAEAALAFVPEILSRIATMRNSANTAAKSRVDRAPEGGRAGVLDALRRDQLAEILAVGGDADAKEDGSSIVITNHDDDAINVHADAWLNTGLALLELNRPREALIAIRCSRRLLILDAVARADDSASQDSSIAVPAATASAVASADASMASELNTLATAEAYAVQQMAAAGSSAAASASSVDMTVASDALKQLISAYDADFTFFLSDRDQGKLRDAAKDLYTSVSAPGAPANAQAQAVAINNLAALRGSSSDKPADMLKKLETAVTTAGDRLTPTQVRGVRLNTCLLLAHARKYPECKDLLSKLGRALKESPGKNEFPVLMNAFVAIKEKAYDQAEKILTTHTQSHPRNSLLCQLAKIHIYVVRDNYAAALSELEAFVQDGSAATQQFPEIRHAPAVTALRVAFLERMGKSDAAVKLLEEEIEYCTPKGAAAQDKANWATVLVMREQAVELRFRAGETTHAISALQGLVQGAAAGGQVGKQRKYLARLILALADTDPAAAARYAKDLEKLSIGMDTSSTVAAGITLSASQLNDLEVQSISALKVGAAGLGSETKRDETKDTTAAEGKDDSRVATQAGDKLMASGKKKYSPEKLAAVRLRKKMRRVRHVPMLLKQALGPNFKKDTATVKEMNDLLAKVAPAAPTPAEAAAANKGAGKGKRGGSAAPPAPTTLQHKANPNRWKPKWEQTTGTSKDNTLGRGPQGSGVADQSKVEVSIVPTEKTEKKSNIPPKVAAKAGRRR